MLQEVAIITILLRLALVLNSVGHRAILVAETN